LKAFLEFHNVWKVSGRFCVFLRRLQIVIKLHFDVETWKIHRDPQKTKKIHAPDIRAGLKNAYLRSRRRQKPVSAG
jgi:hypothetical protein